MAIPPRLRALAAAAWLAPAAALGQAVPEYDLKAAFLYNFALFVDWPAEGPPEERRALTLCVLGGDPFGHALDALEGKTVRSQRLAVRRLASAQAAVDCQILFIAATEEARLAHILKAVQGRPVLTVADSDGWLEQGVMINVSTRQARLAFDVNLAAARQAGLRVSSRLLRLAHLVLGR